jgi:penicillin-binding protein 1C
MRRRAKRLTLIAVALLVAPLVALHVTSYFVTMPDELRAAHDGSVRVLDRDGHLLREVRPKDGSRTAWVRRSDAPLVAQALVATEDRRFWSHSGVDYVAIARALGSNLAHGRTVSGASTITMQLARAVRPHPRTLAGKFTEAALALRIERELDKDQILEQYINRVAFGPNLRGAGAASSAYFDKPPAALSLGEAALLAGVVRGPSYYDLARHPDAARARRETVLARMVSAGAIGEGQRREAQEEPVVLQQRSPAFGAPHFVRALLAGKLGAVPDASGGSIATTIDGDLQRAAETATQHVLGALASRNVTAAGAIVMDNDSGDILAYVGSPDFFDDARGGQNDAVTARRQPGSTLKPFVYELAMERLGMTPATVLPDVELHLPTPAGDFSPHDYDGAFHGPVRMRDALANSLNVPAVWVADRLGTAALLARLQALGFSLDASADHYGAALALGDGEVTLLELAGAYATLARGGVAKRARAALAVDVAGTSTRIEPGDEVRVLPELPVARVTDVLKDARARVASFGEDSPLEFGFDVAGKTGTSKGYRDNWAAGYTRQITVAVWVGNFDGSPMDSVSGITGAGPLFHEIMVAAMRAREKLPLPITQEDRGTPLERVAVCPLSGGRVTGSCAGHVFEWLTHDEAANLGFCEMHVGGGLERYPPEYAAWAQGANRPLAPAEPSDANGGALTIRYPLDGERFVIDPDRPRSAQVLTVSVVAPAGTREVALTVDGAVVDREATPYVVRWPLSPGDHVLIARAGPAESAPVAIHVRE